MIPQPQNITQEGRRQAFDLALGTLHGEFEPSHVYAWLHANAPWIDDVWIEGRLIADTVNDRRREHMPGPRDILYGRPDGRFERYDPKVHGWWSNVGLPAERPTESAAVTRLVVPAVTDASAPPEGEGLHIRRRKAG